MATIELAKNQFVSELKAAVMIHPHSGQEEFVRGALDKFAAAILPPVVDDAPTGIEADDCGSGTEKAGAGDFAGDGDPYGIKQYSDQSFQGPYTPIAIVDEKPSAADLDAVAEEQAAPAQTEEPAAAEGEAVVGQ